MSDSRFTAQLGASQFGDSQLGASGIGNSSSDLDSASDVLSYKKALRKKLLALRNQHSANLIGVKLAKAKGLTLARVSRDFIQYLKTQHTLAQELAEANIAIRDLILTLLTRSVDASPLDIIDSTLSSLEQAQLPSLIVSRDALWLKLLESSIKSKLQESKLQESKLQESKLDEVESNSTASLVQIARDMAYYCFPLLEMQYYLAVEILLATVVKEKIVSSSPVRANLLSTAKSPKSRSKFSFSSYLAKGNEIPTYYLHYLLSDNDFVTIANKSYQVEMLVPLTIDNRETPTMEMVEISRKDVISDYQSFTINKRILEPPLTRLNGKAPRAVALDLYLVPALAFDNRKQLRLGYGGGYYDAFLAQEASLDTKQTSRSLASKHDNSVSSSRISGNASSVNLSLSESLSLSMLPANGLGYLSSLKACTNLSTTSNTAISSNLTKLSNLQLGSLLTNLSALYQELFISSRVSFTEAPQLATVVLYPDYLAQELLVVEEHDYPVVGSLAIPYQIFTEHK